MYVVERFNPFQRSESNDWRQKVTKVTTRYTLMGEITTDDISLLKTQLNNQSCHTVELSRNTQNWQRCHACIIEI